MSFYSLGTWIEQKIKNIGSYTGVHAFSFLRVYCFPAVNICGQLDFRFIPGESGLIAMTLQVLLDLHAQTWVMFFIPFVLKLLVLKQLVFSTAF